MKGLRCWLLAFALGACHSRSESVLPPAAPAAPAGADTRAALPERQGRSLTIASWNLDWLNRRNQHGPVPRSDGDYERLQRYAQRLAADVVAVQEVDGQEALRRVFAEAEYDYHVTSQREVQRAGFVYRKGLSVERHPDLDALNVGGVRTGADLTVRVNGQSLRLLSVHLKSDCFAASLRSPKPACVKLQAQLPVLERWIDERAAAGEPFLVLGDFNRRLNAADEFYAELDDGSPPNADLTLLSDGHPSKCWAGKYPELIDHMLLSRDALPWLKPASFSQLEYEAADARFKPRLSDHCPISVVLIPGSAHVATASQQDSGSAAPAAAPPALPALPIKGNINARRQKLYHRPGCPSYASTRIDELEGERFFATEADAIAAGWVLAPGCR
jgi:endonuclease/exonuclease/phosphatase family metal-dependent hydrolase